MKRIYSILISFFLFQFLNAQYEGYSEDSWNDQLKIEESFLKNIDKTSFKKHLKKLTERPHVVGSEGKPRGYKIYWRGYAACWYESYKLSI